ncbi:MAG TPA: hypothetical protein VL172_00110 [Kofleriaceae bacterium]|nr:hypothetical protein [Kofleriaceae bacterium]
MALRFVLTLGALGACHPHPVPPGPGTEPDKGLPVAAPTARKAASPAREVLIGEMCPQAADGRPAVLPVAARRLTWTTDDDEVSAPIERSAARQFSVFRWDGARAGLFAVAGSADLGQDRPAAIGAYAGSSPCTRGADKEELDADCVAAQSQCGLAVAQIGGTGFGSAPYGDDPDPAELVTGGGCVADGLLLVDIDGDGDIEAFPAAGFVDEVRHPADEVDAVPRQGARCQPHFAARQVIPADEPHWGGLDLLGVVDVDGDGRRELVLSYHYPDGRTWAVYSATASAGRLELAAEAVPWPRP